MDLKFFQDLLAKMAKGKKELATVLALCRLKFEA